MPERKAPSGAEDFKFPPEPENEIKPESPEYHNEEWEGLKKETGSIAHAVQKGRELGVPKEEMDKFIQDAINRKKEEGNYRFVYRFMKNQSIGTAEEVRAMGEKAYQTLLEMKAFDPAMSIAEEVYGKDSEEWIKASESWQKERVEIETARSAGEQKIDSGETELNLTLSKDATFADLFRAIDALAKKEGIDALDALGFESELFDNFDPEIADQIESLKIDPAKARATKLTDFFKEKGYSQKDITVFLPIKFKRGKRNK